MSQQDQVLRTIDKVDKLGVSGVVDLLQKPEDEFGANLDQVRAKLIGQFLECKGGDNNETLLNLTVFLNDHLPRVMRRLHLMELLESTPGKNGTAFDDLLNMPTEESEQWGIGTRPKNIAWALDDIANAIVALSKPKGDDDERA